MAVRDDRGDVKQTTTGFRGPLMVQSLTSAKSKFLSLESDFESRGFTDGYQAYYISVQCIERKYALSEDS